MFDFDVVVVVVLTERQDGWGGGKEIVDFGDGAATVRRFLAVIVWNAVGDDTGLHVFGDCFD